MTVLLEEEQKQASFTAQLVTKIVDNLQISINNIHIRYEDSHSNPDVSSPSTAHCAMWGHTLMDARVAPLCGWDHTVRAVCRIGQFHHCIPLLATSSRR